MGTNTEYDAVIFDNDGVLTTPTDYDVLVDATYNAFASVGAAEPTRDHVETLLGPDVESLRRVADDHGVDPADLWAARERAAIEAQLEEIRAGRKRLYDDVSVLDRLEKPSAIVSNNQHETIENILEYLDIGGFDVCYGREPSIEGIQRKKPNTYYLESAIDDLGVANPLYVGDSRVDVTAAVEAGIDSAFVRRDHREGYDLPTEPDYEIDSLAALEDLV
ncbi:HAD family hydrolase [Halopiger aswanensis]|uniref:HAD superfamily hydrolase (TIGR01549 family) n=1 Tax=Halopiger aswanensis TaxID=148449 RepID=A0A419WI88_9EURY|nr:HAD-IA family hydrolase [Halopiger aswanensis]RKD95162.1 HAD superfamily hydrolase (TIGR01549 family) [Halopiger aswanensis]